MIDTVQIVLISVIVILAILFVVLGIQVFFILQELRKTLVKTNKLLDDVDQLTESVSEPVTFISNLFFSTKTFATIANFIRSIRKRQSENE